MIQIWLLHRDMTPSQWHDSWKRCLSFFREMRCFSPRDSWLFGIHMTGSTASAISPKSTISRNSIHFSVFHGTNSIWDFGLSWIGTKKSEFFNFVDFGGVAPFQLESVKYAHTCISRTNTQREMRDFFPRDSWFFAHGDAERDSWLVFVLRYLNGWFKELDIEVLSEYLDSVRVLTWLVARGKKSHASEFR